MHCGQVKRPSGAAHTSCKRSSRFEKSPRALGTNVMGSGRSAPSVKQRIFVRSIRDSRDFWQTVASRLFGSLSLVPLGEVSGYVYLDNETSGFTGKEVIFALEKYAASLKPPFFGALMDYDYEGNQMCTCPGHQGGAFYRRSPAGRLFVALGSLVGKNVRLRKSS